MTIHNAFRASHSPGWDAASVPPLPTPTLSCVPTTPSNHPLSRVYRSPPAARLYPPLRLRFCSLLSLCLSSDFLCLLCPPIFFSTAPRPLRPSTNCYLCRALTPPEHLYGGWAGSGPGTGGKPPFHRRSAMDGASTPRSASQSTFASPGCGCAAAATTRSDRVTGRARRPRPKPDHAARLPIPCARRHVARTRQPKATPIHQWCSATPPENDSDVSRIAPRHTDTAPGGCYRTVKRRRPLNDSWFPGRRPRRVPFRTQHPLGVVVNRPSVGLTDDLARRAGLNAEYRLTAG